MAFPAAGADVAAGGAEDLRRTSLDSNGGL